MLLAPSLRQAIGLKENDTHRHMWRENDANTCPATDQRRIVRVDQPGHGLCYVTGPRPSQKRRASRLQPDAICLASRCDKWHGRELSGAPVDPFEQNQMCSIKKRFIPVVRVAPAYHDPQVGSADESIDLTAGHRVDIAASRAKHGIEGACHPGDLAGTIDKRERR